MQGHFSIVNLQPRYPSLCQALLPFPFLSLPFLVKGHMVVGTPENCVSAGLMDSDIKRNFLASLLLCYSICGKECPVHIDLWLL